ncbi:MAG: hypothetical protein ACP5KD_03870 [Fervidobacterium sp.]
MSKHSIRIAFYVMTLASVILFVLTFRYYQKVKTEPLAVVDGIHGTFIVNGHSYSGSLIIEPGKSYQMIGQVKIKLFNGITKIVKLTHFEVEVVWAK